MENNKKSLLFEEEIKKIKYRFDYKINESPRYKPLVGDNEEFDELPLTNEAGEQEDAPKPEGGETPPTPSTGEPVGVTEPKAPVPSFSKSDDNNAPAGEEPSVPEAPVPATEAPAPEVDDIQNEIIKHNIEAMKNIHNQLKGLNDMTQQLNAKLSTLTADVEEVREPSNAEKLINKKNVSYPYYFNLNDLWTGNWFDQQREKELSGGVNNKGMNKLPDGTFIADFDDLPQKSKIDIQNSFNEF